MFNWSLYNGNLSWLQARTIYLTRHGSWAYGTNIAASDEDFRGVAIAPREFYLGGLHRFEQAVCNAPDLTIFDLKKFVGLASQANPNVIEILFVDDSDRLVVSPAGERLLGARDLFLSRRIKHTFSGYARAQLKRIDAHYRWLTRPPTSQPTRADFKLPERTLIPQDQLAAAEAGIRQKLDGWSVDFLDDLSIRNGAWPYEKLREWAETEDAALEEVAKTSPLPKSPDIEAIDRVCVELISGAIS